MALAILGNAAASGAESGIIYFSNFENGVGPEWSTNAESTTPSARKFLGEFANDTVSLTVNSLPSHTNLIVSFDLLILRSWDGNADPDVWDLRLPGAIDPLVHTTFSQNRNNGLQRFPNAFTPDSASNLARTGASEFDSLGYTNRTSLYHLSVAFPHADASIALNFSATNLQSITDESWGLDNVVVAYGSAPVVSIKNITNDMAFVAPAQINVGADASSDVVRVEFLTNGVLVATSAERPFEVTLNAVPAGIYPITVRAVNSSGLSAEATATVFVNGLRAEYYNTTTFDGAKSVTRVDPTINFSWDDHNAQPGFSGSAYSVRWTGYIVPKFSELYTLTTTSDDGVRLWVEGERLVDDWRAQAEKSYGYSLPLVAGHRYFVQVDYYNEVCCGARAGLSWSSPSQPMEIIPQERLEPILVAINRPPNKPVITSPALVNNPADPSSLTLAVDIFSDPNTKDTHLATDWEIWTTRPFQRVWSELGATGTNRLATVLKNGIFENSHAGRTNLMDNTRYLVRARHRDNSQVATSEWSDFGQRWFDTIPRVTLVQSAFDESADGWTTTDENPPFRPVFFAAAEGNPGGAAVYTEGNGDSSTSFWTAPAKFVGNISGAYEGTLSFDLRQASINSQYDAVDISLEGAGLRLTFDTLNNPGTNWTSYTIPLTEQTRWRVEGLDGRPATQGEFLAVLANLKKLSIRGEFKNGGNEDNYLDNVRISQPAQAETAILKVSLATPASVVLEWPSNAAGFALEERSINGGVWLDLHRDRVTLNGLITVMAGATESGTLYRLRK